MIGKHLPFILRRFGRQKLTTSLHILGLTLGITVCLLIGLFIHHELSFDKYHAKADRTYRVNQVWNNAGKKELNYAAPFALADLIRKDVTGLENVTKVHFLYEPIVEINPVKRFREDKIMMTDPEFLDVFDVKVLEGNGHEALRKPYQALLTQSLAKKYYGNEDPLGKVFKYNNEYNITVAGVIADFPGNTHLPATMLLSFSTDEKYIQASTTHLGSVSFGSTFIVLSKGAKANSGLTASLNAIYDKTINKEPYMLKDMRAELAVQPLSDIHFNSAYNGGGYLVQAINKSWLWFFASVGIAVLALACINFVNLSTAQALTRAKEVGVRKTVGAGRFQLISQFLAEALVLVLFSGIVAIVITKLALPYVNDLADKQITFDVFQSPWILLALVTGLIITVLMAGFYPAWLITKFRPAATLKSGSVNSNPQSVLLRKGLVIAQFSISVCLLIAVLLIGKQMEYIRSKNLGFNKDNIVMTNVPFSAPLEKKELVRNQLAAIPGVKDVAFSTSPPSGDKVHWGTIMSTTALESSDRQSVTTIMTDDHYFQLYDLKLKAGRFPVATDTNLVSKSVPEGQRYARSVVNEKLVKALGFASNEAALGQRFFIGMNGWKAEVVGVIEDFNTSSLHDAIKPTLITQHVPFTQKANIKLQAGTDIPAVISKISAVQKEFFPKDIFEFNFLDAQIDALYKAEERLYGLFKIFSALAILISCLGLWGLVTFAAQQRIKEIGIRKVLGASVTNIITLLTKDFVVLVGIAIVIATPLTYWGIHKWLQDFEFRTNIGWTVFIIAGAGALLIAILTVSFQAIKAAIANPVKSLRTE
jgi:ABC-type antimicrobial peptide transport system permease subunit